MKQNRLFIFLVVATLLAACGGASPASPVTPTATGTTTATARPSATFTPTRQTTPWYLLVSTRSPFPHHIYPTWTPRSATQEVSATPRQPMQEVSATPRRPTQKVSA